MGKIAVELERALLTRRVAGSPGTNRGRPLASGDGWNVLDVICTLGPEDRPYEERHTQVSVAMVVAGTLDYRTPHGRVLLTPGSILLGNSGECFECGHEHGAGDRCIAFRFEAAFFDRLAADTGAGASARRFRAPRVPPLRDLSAIVARASAGALGAREIPWEELALEVGAAALTLQGDARARRRAEHGVVTRVARSVRAIERDPASRLPLGQLAARAGVSPFHFLRTFQEVTGATPHQFILRQRLRDAAVRLASGDSRVIEVAFESGFDDLSNFNRAFRTEFGSSPTVWRRHGTSSDAQQLGDRSPMV